ncbi:MAG: class I SAM-dependent methyltransferase [Dehalococcoidia bacterium]|jgi:ubiquinone/menaquinone biosynthesis C-methylase UbiE
MPEGHFDTNRAPILDSEERIKELRPYQLLKDTAGVTSGMTCIDLGCGTGTFSFPMLLCVGSEGVVYAIDDSAEMLEHIRAKNPPPNLILVHGDVSQTGLDNEIADFCLLAFIMHEVEQPANLLAEVFRLLKPEGRLLVIEWKADLDSPGPPQSRRLYRETVDQLFKQADLRDFEYIDWSKNHYVTTGSKMRTD